MTVVQEVIDFLSGKSDVVMERLQAQMTEAARAMRFEQAAQIRDRMKDAQSLMERQKAINVRGGDQDILACCTDGIDAMVEVVFVRGGRMIGAEHYALEGAGDQRCAKILSQFIISHTRSKRRVKDSSCLEG